MSTGRARKWLIAWSLAMASSTPAQHACTCANVAVCSLPLLPSLYCRTWEWQPEAMLRGYTHPLLFACLYKVLAVLVTIQNIKERSGKVMDCTLLHCVHTQGLDTPWACHFGPRMLQGSLVVVQDLAVYRLTRRLFGTRAAQFALLCHVGAWFVAYCSVRTFSNSLEAVLMTLVLAYWPLRPLHIRQGTTVQPVEPDSDVAEGSYAPATMTWCLLGAAVTVVIRPSSALFWLFLGLRLLWHSSQYATFPPLMPQPPIVVGHTHELQILVLAGRFASWCCGCYLWAQLCWQQVRRLTAGATASGRWCLGILCSSTCCVASQHCMGPTLGIGMPHR